VTKIIDLIADVGKMKVKHWMMNFSFWFANYSENTNLKNHIYIHMASVGKY